MADITQLPPPPDQIAMMKGAKPAGHKVIVDGMEIPNLTMLDDGETIHLILDGRFGIDVPRKLAPQVAWLTANALAIGQGYSHIGASSKEKPFAPTVMYISELPKEGV